jgi:transposase
MGRKIAPVEWAQSADELYERYRAEPEVGRRKRLQALWLVRQGRTAGEAALQAGIGARSVTRWLAWYRAEGLDAVLERLPGHGALGAPCRLTPEQRAELIERSAQGQFRTSGEVRDWVATHWSVEYRESGMYSLLARHKVHPKVPRPQAAKADPAAQEAWKKGG